jgi:hypothetical protein
MKKHLIIIAAALLAVTASFSLAGCGGGNKSDDAKASQTVSETAAEETKAEKEDASAVSEADTVFSYDGVDVELNGDAAAAVEALGEPENVESQLSCHATEGDDKTYTYNGFVLNTYPLDGEDRVLEVVINSEGIPTKKGVEVGDDVAKVTKAYGEGYKAIGMYYAYEAGNGKSIQFLIENDKVSEIDYYYDV